MFDGRRARGIAFASVPLALAAAGPLFAGGWFGHGLYKIALLALPFVAPRRGAWRLSGGIRASTFGAVTGIVLGAAGLALLAVLLPAFAPPEEIRANLDARYGYDSAGEVLVAVGLLMTANAALEEWFYRGFLDRKAGVFPSALTFGMQHTIVLSGVAGLAPALLAGGGTFLAGLVFSFHAARGGLLPAFASHMAADAVLLVGGMFVLGYLP